MEIYLAICRPVRRETHDSGNDERRKAACNYVARNISLYMKASRNFGHKRAPSLFENEK